MNPDSSAATSGQPKASAGMRALAAVGGIVLLFGAAIMFFLVTNPDDLPLCSELQGFGECFDLSRTQYNLSRALAAPAGILAAAAGFLGFYVAARGTRGALMVRLAGAAAALAALAVIINRVF